MSGFVRTKRKYLNIFAKLIGHLLDVRNAEPKLDSSSEKLTFGVALGITPTNVEVLLMFLRENHLLATNPHHR